MLHHLNWEPNRTASLMWHRVGKQTTVLKCHLLDDLSLLHTMSTTSSTLLACESIETETSPMKTGRRSSGHFHTLPGVYGIIAAVAHAHSHRVVLHRMAVDDIRIVGDGVFQLHLSTWAGTRTRHPDCVYHSPCMMLDPSRVADDESDMWELGAVLYSYHARVAMFTNIIEIIRLIGWVGKVAFTAYIPDTERNTELFARFALRCRRRFACTNKRLHERIVRASGHSTSHFPLLLADMLRWSKHERIAAHEAYLVCRNFTIRRVLRSALVGLRCDAPRPRSLPLQRARNTNLLRDRLRCLSIALPRIVEDTTDSTVVSTDWALEPAYYKTHVGLRCHLATLFRPALLATVDR